MEKYGFVYIWFDRKHKRYYIGSHWGTENDGYVCSSRWMRNSYKRRPSDFKRRILRRIDSSRQDLLTEEYRWLEMILENEIGIKYYNLTRHLNGHWSTDDKNRLSVGQKISQSPHRSEKISKKAKQRAIEGKCFTDHARERQKIVMKNYKHSDDTKAKISLSLIGRDVSDETRKKISKKHIGKSKPPLTEEHKKKISMYNKGRKHSNESLIKMSKNSAGKHKGTVAVTTKDGINTRVCKKIFDIQKVGLVETWQFVSVSSKESKKRREKK
jgi:hypothetical protein